MKNISLSSSVAVACVAAAMLAACVTAAGSSVTSTLPTLTLA